LHEPANTAELDSVLDILADCDTVLLSASTTYEITDRHSFIEDIDLFIIGESPRPTLECSINTGSTAVLEYRGDNETPHFEIRNVDLDFTGANTAFPFIKVLNYGDVVVDSVDGDLVGTYLFFTSDSTTVTNCDLDAKNFAFDVSRRTGTSVEPTYLFDNVTLHSTNTSTASNISARFSSTGGILSVVNSTFTSSASTNRYLAIVANSTGVETVNITLEDNNFNDSVFHTKDTPTASDDITLNVDYEGNDSDVDECVDSTFTADEGTATVILDITHWEFEGNYLSFLNMGNVGTVGSVSSWCAPDQFVYVQFKLTEDKEDYFHNHATVDVNYSENGGSLNHTATACWNSTTDKWNAKLEVSDWKASGKVDWAAEVTLCDSTKVGTTKTTYFREDWGKCADPFWYDCP